MLNKLYKTNFVHFATC